MPRGLLATYSLAWYLAVMWYVPQLLEPYLSAPGTPPGESLFTRLEHRSEREASDASDLAMAVLENASHFMSARVGSAGVVPPEVHAWLLISRAPDAENLFRQLSRSPRLGAAAFGAAGLAYLSPEALEVLRRNRASETDSVVLTQRGCVLTDRPFGELLEEIAGGRWWTEYLRL